MKFFHKTGCFELEKKTFIMGILNITPDSFANNTSLINNGYFKSTKYIDDVLYTAEKMQQDGADLLDIGGESTRPGFLPVSEEEEISRILPVIEKIHKNIDLPISVDTTKSVVAEVALRAGADIVNDVWGGIKDEKMLSVVKNHSAGFIVGHNRASPKSEDTILSELEFFFNNVIKKAVDIGIPKDFLCLDPNIGFAKTYEENIKIMKNLLFFSKFTMPLLIGVSRKSIVGQTLGLPVEERLEGSLALAIFASLNGINFVRVHDVKETARALKMIDKLNKLL